MDLNETYGNPNVGNPNVGNPNSIEVTINPSYDIVNIDHH